MKIQILWPIILLGITGQMGCQSAETKSVRGNQAPSVTSVSFFPEVVRQGDEVTVLTEGDDPEGETLAYRFEWTINGKQTNHTDRSVPAGVLKRGDRISVRIVPNDGSIDGAPFDSGVLVVGNSPPEIVSIHLLPQVFRPGESIQALVEARDNEGDEISFDYEWKVNGNPLFAANRDRVKIDNLKKGDIVTVTVTPYDGNAAGKPVASASSQQVNHAPQITSSPPPDFIDGVYAYPVVAIDLDGDRLDYSIQNPQPGMEMGEGGLFQWRIPESISGVHQVVLVVRDAEGEAAAQQLRLDVDYLRRSAQ